MSTAQKNNETPRYGLDPRYVIQHLAKTLANLTEYHIHYATPKSPQDIENVLWQYHCLIAQLIDQAAELPED